MILQEAGCLLMDSGSYSDVSPSLDFDDEYVFCDNGSMISEHWNNGRDPASEQGRHIEHFDSRRTRLLGFISFLFGFSGAFPLYVASSYFESAIGDTNVSIFYLITFSIVLAGLFFLHAFLRLVGGISGFLILLFLLIVVHVPIVVASVSILGSVFVILYFVIAMTAWVSLDIVLEHFSDDRRSGRIRSLHLTAMNAGLLLAPFLSTRILDRFGFSGVFCVSLGLFIGLFIFSTLVLHGMNIRYIVHISPLGIMRSALHRVDILRIYAVSFAMEFFYAVMIVYTPVYLRQLGMSWGDIGIVLTVMLVPFVLVQYPLGLLADRRTGEKELLIVAILLAAISTACIPLLGTPSVLLWSVVLFLTRLGVAAIEVLRDSYFFKRVDGRNPELISFFRTAGPLASICAAAILVFWLQKLPLSSVFVLPTAVFLFALIPTFFLRDNLGERERGVSP